MSLIKSNICSLPYVYTHLDESGKRDDNIFSHLTIAADGRYVSLEITSLYLNQGLYINLTIEDISQLINDLKKIRIEMATTALNTSCNHIDNLAHEVLRKQGL